MLLCGLLPLRKKWNQIRIKLLRSIADIWTEAESQKISHNVVLLQQKANEGKSPN
jgi:hypothetical protein